MVNLDGTELTDEEAEELFGLSDQAMLDDDVVDDSDEDDIPIQVRERVEEHLARFEKGAVVEPPESFKVCMHLTQRCGVDRRAVVVTSWGCDS